MLKDVPTLPSFATIEEERKHLKERLAAGFRLFADYGFEEGNAGHITVRDPEYPDRFWVNPFGKSFSKMKASDLILVTHDGEVVEGDGTLNLAAFAIHAKVHEARPDIVAAAHTHSLYGKTWSAFGRLLDPLTLDACVFYNDHALLDAFQGRVLDTDEGELIGKTLGDKKAIILKHHGLLTVGETVDSAIWWFITMERACQSQILAESIGKPDIVPADIAAKALEQIGNEQFGWFNFQPFWERMIDEYPELAD